MGPSGYSQVDIIICRMFKPTLILEHPNLYFETEDG
jgi:hypothetical protein